MKVQGKHYRTIWEKQDELGVVQIIDQRWLPHRFVVEDLKTVDEVAIAIKDMHVRGAGLIGATAGYGMALAALENPDMEHLTEAGKKLISTRPTAVNLAWAVNRQLKAIRKGESEKERIDIAFQIARKIADEDANYCKRIGEHGVEIIKEIAKRKNASKENPVNILTHCNAGWLAFVDYGSATSPIYEAFNQGIPIHVYVDETHPRNQGARLTAWELGEQGVPHTIISDNTGGHLMQHGLVDMAIVGTDRTTYTGDVANKIGTYLKALAAKDNNIPFYVALPSSTFDWDIEDGLTIPIEQRGSEEVRYIQGLNEKTGKIEKVLLTPKTSSATNYAFDVTPSRLITGLITERGICQANKESILQMFPEHTIINMAYQGTKFQTQIVKRATPRDSRLRKLKHWCRVFHDKGLAPPYEGGSYGNLSYRLGREREEFVITASNSSLRDSQSDDRFALVHRVDLRDSVVSYSGKRKPSSEAMLHHVIYTQRQDIGAIFHGHCPQISENAERLKIPITSRFEEYGTIELANSVLEILGDNNFIQMRDHGFISLGKSMKEAGELALEFCGMAF